MKKTTYLLLIGLSLSILMLSSCKSILEQEPRNSTHADAFWQNSQDIRSALAGNYALLRAAMSSGNFNNNPRYFMYGDAIAGTYFTIQYVGDGLEGIQTGDFTFQYNIQSYGNWTDYYKAIAMSNIILNRVPGIPEENLTDVPNATTFKNQVLGQAFFLRALAYFMLVRVWGDVPIVLEEYSDPISAPELARAPKDDVMRQIEDDCHRAAELLTWSYPSAGEAKVTANRGAVYALLAHLYLWRATMRDVSTDQPDMTDVHRADTTIAALLANGNYSLTDTANYYQTFVGRSPEGIFEINMSENQREGSATHIAHQFLRQQHIAYNSATYSRYYVPPAYLSSHFYKIVREWGWVWNEAAWEWEWKEIETRQADAGDIRYRKNFADVATNTPTCIKYSNVVYRNPAQQLEAYVSNNIIVFRLSDMLLLQAEIALYKGETERAREIINMFRIRNGADATALLPSGLSQSALMNEYMLERGKEMYLEGHLYYDLLRTRQYGNFITWLTESRFRQEGFYWPVDPALFRNNLKLRQTTYWRGKV